MAENIYGKTYARIVIPQEVLAKVEGTVAGTEVTAKAYGTISRGIKEILLSEDGDLSFVLTDGQVVLLGNIKGAQGLPGIDGDPGADGFSPTVEIRKTATGHDVIITDKDGTNTFFVPDGTQGKDGYTPQKGIDYFDGKDGEPGKDGYTPIKGVDYFDGEPGKDGYTPVKGIDYFDGEPGKDGKDYVLTQADKEEIAAMIPGGGGGGSAEVTAESIKEALGYTPADEADIPEVPTKVSAFENDAGYITAEEVPEGGGVTSWNDLEDRPFGAENVFEPIVIPDSFKDVNTGEWYDKNPIDLGSMFGYGEMLFYKGNIQPSNVEDYLDAVIGNNHDNNINTNWDYIDMGLPEGMGLFYADLPVDDVAYTFNIAIASKENPYGFPIGVYFCSMAGDYSTTKLTIFKEIVTPIDIKYFPDGALKGVLYESDIVDNLYTLSQKKPLSAQQGHVLDKKIVSLTNLANEAKSTAEIAFTRATTAMGTADNAQFTAYNAETTATNASNKVDDLEERLENGEFGGGTNADWLQNDETAADYIKNKPFYTEGNKFEPILFPDSFYNTETGEWYSDPIDLGPLFGVDSMIFHIANVQVSDVENYIGATYDTYNNNNTTKTEFNYIENDMLPKGMGLFEAQEIFYWVDSNGSITESAEVNFIVGIVAKENEFGLPIGVYCNSGDINILHDGIIYNDGLVRLDEKYMPKSFDELQYKTNQIDSKAIKAWDNINEIKPEINELTTTVSDTITLANTANSTATQAKTAAQNAQATANEAKSTAQSASNLVNNALDSTERAIAKADEAKTTADEAKTLAETAKSRADDAHNTAVSTSQFASEVEDLARQADDNAREALSKATSALLEVSEIEVPDVVQSAGQSTEAVMSQKAVTDLVSAAINGGGDGEYETVDSIAEMVDTTKSYILKSTGTVWSWLPSEIEVFNETTEEFKATANNPAYDGKSLSTSGMSDGSAYVSTPYIDLYEYGFPCTLHMNGLEWVTATPKDKIRVKAYNENKEYIMLYSTALSGSGFWSYAETGNVTIVDSSHANVAFPSAYYINTSKAVRYLQFCAIGTWAQADISVTYMKKEIVKGEPKWQDTGIAVTDNTDFCLVNASVKGFVDNVTYNDNDYSTSSVGNYCAKDYYRQDLPLPVVLNWNADPMAASYAISLGETENFSAASATIYYSNTNRIEIYHLLPNKTFYYKVTAILFSGNKKVLKEGSFTTQANKTRMLNIEGIQNVRDIGGYTTEKGRNVKYGLIFRGSAMDEEATRHLRISGNGAHELLKVGIKTDLDLRYGHTESPLGIDYIKTSSGYENYAKAFTVKTQRTNFKNLFESIINQLEVTGEEAAEGEVVKPVYIHCQGGCDRTGTLVFQLLGLLGVPENDLAKEYELSSFSPIGFTRLRSGEKYSGMIAQIKNNYAGNTIGEKLIDFATKSNDDTETGGCGIDAKLITTFRNLVLDGEPETEKYVNLFDTTASGFDNQSSKFFTNWIPYNSADNGGNGTIYHFKGMASTSSPYKVTFATDANGTGETSAVYCNALNRQSRTTSSYDSKVNILQHFIEGYSYARFEFREALASNLIITANQDIID